MLKLYGGNKSKAAEVLGISRQKPFLTSVEKKVDDPHADQHEDNARQGTVGKEHLPVIFLDEIYFRRDHEQTIIEPIPDVKCR